MILAFILGVIALALAYLFITVIVLPIVVMPFAIHTARKRARAQGMTLKEYRAAIKRHNKAQADAAAAQAVAPE